MHRTHTHEKWNSVLQDMELEPCLGLVLMGVVSAPLSYYDSDSLACPSTPLLDEDLKHFRSVKVVVMKLEDTVSKELFHATKGKVREAEMLRSWGKRERRERRR